MPLKSRRIFLVAQDFIFSTTVKLFPFEEISRWIPFATQPQVVEDFLANYALHPNLIPTEEKHLIFLQAAIRETFRKQKSQVGANQKIFMPDYARLFARSDQESLLILLDTQEPEGIVEVFVKKKGDDVHLATVVAPSGQPVSNKKEKVLTAGFDFKIKEKQELTLLADEIQRVPLPLGEHAQIKIRCASGFKLEGKATLNSEVSGSVLGVVFDGRGRPLSIPSADPHGRERLLSWQNALNIESF